MRTAAVIGTGLIGTSVALALTRRGVEVYLEDRDGANLKTATSLGAGKVGLPAEPVDLLVVAVPPGYVAETLVDAQRRGVARAYTDVASVKAGPQREAAGQGIDPATYLGGHPLAGRERSGPLMARADLFEGRPWVLTPTAATGRDALNRVLELISVCGGVPVVMDAEDHDRAVALVSHAPHLVSALMAARLEHASEDAARVAGTGVRDVTRIAAGDPELWEEILTSNATAVADVLDEYAADLGVVVAALRALAAGEAAAEAGDREPGDPESGALESGVAKSDGAESAGAESDGSGPGAAGISGVIESANSARVRLVDLLHRGNLGQARIPGKHGAPSSSWGAVPVVISDAPNELARLFAAVGAAGVNIEDLRIEHSPGKDVGLVTLQVEPDSADSLAQRLVERGWTVQR
jgi:prephenate dehydrogenase